MEETEDSKGETSVRALISKAESSHDPDEALKFSQAACNSANALRCLQDILDAKQ